MGELKLDSRQTAIIVIDLQKGIVGRSCAPQSSSPVVDNAAHILVSARQAGFLDVLCGIATEFGVESAAGDTFKRGYELVLVEGAMTGLTAESHANAVERILPRIGQVRSTDQVVGAFDF